MPQYGLPNFYFRDCVDNYTGTPDATPGTDYTPGTSGADGTAVTLLSALSFDCHFLVVGINGCSLSTADLQIEHDILVDPAGGTSWSVLISNLIAGQTPIIGTSIGYQQWYQFPIFIKAGTSIGGRGAAFPSGSPVAKQIACFAFGTPSRPDMWWCGQGVETLGVANQQGTDITPGNSGTFGSWTSIGSTTTYRYGAIQAGYGNSDAASATNQYHFEIGYGSTRLPGSPQFYASSGTVEVAMRAGFNQPIFCDIAAGTQMQARGTCSGASPEAVNIAMYGVY